MSKFFLKIWRFITNVFMSLDKTVEYLVPIATGIVEGLKKIVESDKTDWILEILKASIPGSLDDKIIDKTMELAKEWIPKIAFQLQIIDEIMDMEKNEQVIQIIKILREANEEQKSDYWHELATFILKKLADGKITLGEAGMIVEYHYQNFIKAKKNE